MTGRRAILGIVVACAAQFLIGADGLAVAIALPRLRDDLGAAAIDAQWVLTAFGLTFGGGLLLVAARAVQGLGAAAAVPAALALIGSLVPEGRARTRALSVMGAMASVGIISGLVIGGLLIEALGWRWMLGVMAAPALAAAVAAPVVLPDARAGAAAAGP